MAYVFDPSLTEEENQRRAAEDQTRASGGILGSGNEPPAGAQPNAGASASGSFTNLQRYIDENRPQAGALAGRVAGQITQAGEDAKASAENLVRSTNEKIDAARVTPSQDVVDEAAQDPGAVASDPTKKASFQKQFNADYTGPSGLEDDAEGYQTAQEKAKKAQDRIKLSETEQGRMEILKDLSPAGSGRGKLTLNQFLLSAAPGNAETIATAARPYENLQSYLTAESDAARQKAQTAAQETRTAREAARAKIEGPTGAATELSKSISDRASQAEAERLAKNQAIQDLINFVEGRADRSVLSPEEEALFIPEGYAGPRPDPIGWVREMNAPASNANWLEQYFPGTKIAPYAADAASVATADEFARVGALEQLLGYDIPELDVGQASRAGSYVAPTVGTFKNPTVGNTVPTKPAEVNIPSDAQAVLEANPGWQVAYTLGNGTILYTDIAGRLRYADGSYFVPGNV